MPADGLEIESAEEMMQDPEEFSGEGIMLLGGDTIMAKISACMELDGQEIWFTYGATTRVMPGEAEEEAYGRLSTVVIGRSLDQVGDYIDELEARRDAFEAQLKANRQQRASKAPIRHRG